MAQSQVITLVQVSDQQEEPSMAKSTTIMKVNENQLNSQPISLQLILNILRYFNIEGTIPFLESKSIRSASINSPEEVKQLNDDDLVAGQVQLVYNIGFSKILEMNGVKPTTKFSVTLPLQESYQALSEEQECVENHQHLAGGLLSDLKAQGINFKKHSPNLILNIKFDYKQRLIAYI